MKPVSYLAVTGLRVKLKAFSLDVSLAIDRHEVLAVLGPSGAGKSVFLESLAGFHPLEAGTVTLDGRRLDTLVPEQRGIGFVFQDYALFPHLTVRENILFSPRLRRKGGDLPPGAGEIMALLKIERLGGRRIQQLSGGERQRVALARALVSDPALLLMDEPMSALDTVIREELRDELRQLLLRLGTTAIYVTHDRNEAATLGHRVAVLFDGRLEQVDPPSRLFYTPASVRVARFVGMTNIFPAVVENIANGSVGLRAGRLRLTAPTVGPVAPGAAVTAGIRPEDVLLYPPDEAPPQNCFAGRVTEVTPQGQSVRVTLDCGVSLTGLLSWRDFQIRRPSPGQTWIAAVEPASVHLMPPERPRILPDFGEGNKIPVEK